jgi:hypothetical protein
MSVGVAEQLAVARRPDRGHPAGLGGVDAGNGVLGESILADRAWVEHRPAEEECRRASRVVREAVSRLFTSRDRQTCGHHGLRIVTIGLGWARSPTSGSQQVCAWC